MDFFLSTQKSGPRWHLSEDDGILLYLTLLPQINLQFRLVESVLCRL
jgi:hypothetical protein